ncbi:MAG: hypothetical protein HQM06_02215 [Magnetococcales bacterium]|nr:hypothetical protein [Magnetococcales bacterium]
MQPQPARAEEAVRTLSPAPVGEKKQTHAPEVFPPGHSYSGSEISLPHQSDLEEPAQKVRQRELRQPKAAESHPLPAPAQQLEPKRAQPVEALRPSTAAPGKEPSQARPVEQMKSLQPTAPLPERIRREPGFFHGEGEHTSPKRAKPIVRQAIALNPATTVFVQQGKEDVTVQHKTADGKEWIMQARPSGKHRPHLEIYQQSRDPDSGQQTRWYPDGRRIVYGKDFVTHTLPQRISLTQHNNGLRSAFLPSGNVERHARTAEHTQRYFQEEFATHHQQGHEQRIIRRTVYARLHGPKVVVLPQPQIWIYRPLLVHRSEVYTYDPIVWQPSIYALLLQPLATPIVVTRECLLCPPPVIVTSTPITTYRQPIDWLTDWQLAGALYDGMIWYAPPAQESRYDWAASGGSESLTHMQRQLAEAMAENETLRSELADKEQQLAAIVDYNQSVVDDRASAGGTSGASRPVTIPDRVRKQMRRQVQEEIERHQQQQPGSLATLLASGEAMQTIFQVAERLDVTDSQSGGTCVLTTGDLLQFNRLPGSDESVAAMKIITGKSTSCPVGSVVHVGLRELQEMMNAFSQRLENNVDRLAEELLPPPR